MKKTKTSLFIEITTVFNDEKIITEHDNIKQFEMDDYFMYLTLKDNSRVRYNRKTNYLSDIKYIEKGLE